MAGRWDEHGTFWHFCPDCERWVQEADFCGGRLNRCRECDDRAREEIRTALESPEAMNELITRRLETFSWGN